MAEYNENNGSLGSRIFKFRKGNKLTQMDLAERYKVSGPAIFKFEKGFVTPSLKLWLIIAADMGIPEKEAVLLWIKEKVPKKFHFLIQTNQNLDVSALEKELKEASKQDDSLRIMREVILNNPEISPSLKKFVGNKEMWGIFKPNCDELTFLIELDNNYPRITLAQFREAMIVARQINSEE